jgi:hypothetical protein
VVVAGTTVEPAERPWPYGETSTDDVDARTEPLDIALTPYHGWALRGPSTMRVWIPARH